MVFVVPGNRDAGTPIGVPKGLLAAPNAFVTDNVPYAPDNAIIVAKSEYPAKDAHTSKQTPFTKEYSFLPASISVSTILWFSKGHNLSRLQGVVVLQGISMRFRISAQPGNPK